MIDFLGFTFAKSKIRIFIVMRKCLVKEHFYRDKNLREVTVSLTDGR